MKKIIMHWTAGTNQPCKTDIEHYHYLIDDAGIVVEGEYTPEDNRNCKDGKYAAHTGGGNTDAIGIAVCGMAGFNGTANSTKYPLTRKQCEVMFQFAAQLCKKYGIRITPQTVMTHYEFGQAHPKSSSYGKIDITYLHPFPNVDKSFIGDFIRNKILWYYERL